MTDARPNILWICTDQQRFDTIGALGNPAIRTPHLDRLVAQGVTCTNAYCQSPICTPSRASFLTGRYPTNVRVNRNGNPSFPKDVPLVTRLLADVGYDCVLVGKLHLSATAGRVEARPDDGYRIFKWSPAPRPESFWPIAQHAYQRWLRDQGVNWAVAYGAETPAGWETATLPPEQLRARRDKPVLYRAGITAALHQTTWCIDEAIAFVSGEHAGPWLLSVNPFDPHPPFDPPPEYLARMDPDRMPLPLFVLSDLDQQRALAAIDFQTTPVPPDTYDARRMVAAYYAQIELLDDQIGRLLDALEQTGQRESTVVIFMSDHGEMLGDHGLRLKGCRFYEGLVHVPLLLSWPGYLRSGLRTNALVELVDIAPTLLDLAGLPIPEQMQGRSLLPILTRQADPGWHRDFVRCEYHDAAGMPGASQATMLYDGRHKLGVYHGHEVGELYDLAADPHEFHNLWNDGDRRATKVDFLKYAFDATMQAMDLGPPRVAGY